MRAHRWLLLATLIAACGSSPASHEHAPRSAARLGRYAKQVHARFDPERAHATVAYVDRHFRVRGNEGYAKTLERVRAELNAAGLSPMRALSFGPVRPTWTPRSARLALAGEPEPLIAFSSEADRDRACLLVGSTPVPEREIEVVRAEALRAGESARGRAVLMEGEPRSAIVRRLIGEGAAGVLVRNLELYHSSDPDVAQFGYLPPHPGAFFGFSLSRRAWERLRSATQHGPARVRVSVDVSVGESAAAAIEARIEGTDPSAGAIVFVAHADEPGANDNASGVAALAELAGALQRAIDEGAVLRPRRTLVFLWGQEIEVAREWLADPPLPVGAGLVMDMVGAEPSVVGAPFLIERMPDPGAIWLRAPDAHTEWGAAEITEDALRGHFLNDLVAAATAEVERIDGPWRWRSHPFEGGSDHVAFLEEGLPAVLAWHFTDDAYHTTLDRLERVSGAEMRRVAAVLGAVALALAGDREDGLEVTRIVGEASRARLISLGAASSALIREGRSSAGEEERVRDAWVAWYREALSSIAAWFGEAPALTQAIDSARSRLGP